MPLAGFPLGALADVRRNRTLLTLPITGLDMNGYAGIGQPNFYIVLQFIA
jgi:hypothetical protein